MKRALLVASLAMALPSVARAESPFLPWAPAKEPEKRPIIEDTDHDDVRLRPGVGWFGRMDAPLGRASARALGEVVPVHMLGVRFWFRRAVGLDIAAGAHASFGRRDSGPSTVAFALRASLPVALAIEKHVTLFVAPTLGFTYAGETVPGEKALSPITGLERTPADTRHGGMRFTLGARLGTEVQLGFVKMARLSIVTTIGLDGSLSRTWTHAEPAPTSRDPEPQPVESRSTRFVVRTTFAEDVWAAVLGNVAVLCYF